MTHGSIFDKIWKRMRTPERRCKVAMFHIDLGIGGAEHLFLHAALAAYLFQNGYGKDVVNLEAKKVDVFTTRFDPQRCLATAKSRHTGYDVVFHDQVSFMNPLLRLVGRHVVFYGHFPECLHHERQNTSTLRSIYDAFFQTLEEYFIQSMYRNFYPSLRNMNVTVVYPPVDEEFLQKAVDTGFNHRCPTWIREKRNEIAIEALSYLPADYRCNLIIAGGCDPRKKDDRAYLKFLNGVARSYGYQVFGDSDIDGHSAAISSGPGDGSDTGRRLLFLTNISSALKMHLMDHCVCLIYPPANEHFGIVPCEAMARGCIPIACNSGGPMETITDGETGFLCQDEPKSFAAAVTKIMRMERDDFSSLKAMKERARERAQMFSPGAFATQLQAVFRRVVDHEAKRTSSDL